MPTPSLLIVPARFKTGKLYSQIPTSGAGDFTVTRNTAARRFNSAGLIESVASGIPRLDYYTSGGVTGCPALLVEPSALNLALHSRDLTNAVWSGTNVTTAKNAVGADGVASGATTLTATAASGTVLQSLLHNSFTRVFSAYVRRVTGTGAIQMTTNGGTNWDTVTISSNYTQVACTPRSVASGTVGFRMAVSGDVIEVDFTQGEATQVTSVIPTTTASVTRNADTISVSGAVSGSIGQTEGTLYVEFQNTSDSANRRVIAISDGAATNRILLFTASNSYAARIMSTDVTIGALSVGYHKVAIGYEKSGVSGSIFVSVDGGSVVSGTANSFPASLTNLILGKSESVSQDALYLNARIRAAALYTTRLTNAELAALTA